MSTLVACSRIARRVALATSASALALILSSCHPLVNPVDPSSTAFTGEEITRDTDDAIEPILPRVVAWESVAEHAPGQYLALDIAEDESFVEPRQPASPQRLFIVLTFEEPIDWNVLDQATLFVRVSFTPTSDYVTVAVPLELGDQMVSDRQALLRIEPTTPPFFNSTGDGSGGAVFRMQLVDPNGAILGKRLFGMLPGDFDGNGVVESADFTSGPDAYQGYLASPEIPETIRADADASGSVDRLSRDGEINDQPPTVGNQGTSLPVPPPAF